MDIYAKSYDTFKCIADKCPDSCCKDWDVVVDDESFEIYNKAQGEFGDKLRSLMQIDSDGDRIFVSQNGRCPFWNKDMLCDIYINLGENCLCETCKRFPRLTLDYTAFCEHMLSFACPEAARLMLQNESEFDDFADYDVSIDVEDFDAELMKFLLSCRARTFEILKNRDIPFTERLKQCLWFNAQVQSLLDDDCFSYDVLDLEIPSVADSHKSDVDFIFNLHKSLDIMSKKWRELLSEKCNDIEITDEFLVLALYYVSRYYLCAVDSLDVLSTIKRIVCACVVISGLENNLTLKEGKITAERKCELIQLYSKEVEHSYENSEALEFEFATSSDFSVDNLISIL